MNITILLDHDLEGRVVFFEAALTETGWDRDLHIEFIRLRDLNLPEDSTDREIWLYAQRERLLLITNNRNRDDESSLQAVVETENKADSLPVLTISDQTRLSVPEYRQQVVDKLAAIIIDLENYLGTGRIYLP
jgi:hypothetical protein